jgi:hypothetical protein
MSTKTLRKRIALVAVTALTAGLVSVVSVPAANAGVGDGNIDATAGSIGLVGALSGTGTTRTAVLLSTGSLKISVAAASVAVVSSGAKFTAFTGGNSLSTDQTGAVFADGAETVTVTPTGAIGSTFTITTYDEDTLSAASVIANIVTVTIAGSSLSGVPTAANSGVFWVAAASGSATADASGKSAAAPLGQLFLDIQLADAYNAAFDTAGGALVATATAGATVALATSGTTAGTFTTAVSGGQPSSQYAIITEATAGAGWSGTVTISYNGVVIATKSGTIAGYASLITLSRNKVAASSGSTADTVRFKATDAAGTAVVIPATSLTMKSSSNSAVVSNVVGVDDQVITSGSTADGKATVTCSTAGTSDVVMQYVTPAGKTITTAPLTVLCGGGASTYTAAFNKAVYVQGELATLTVSFKDSKGAAASSGTDVTALVSNLSNEVIVAPMMTLVGTVSTTALKPDANGNVVFTYSVGATTGITPGAYQASVSFPTINSQKGVAQAVGYTVSAPAGVSNADVLKAIVSLIASINKQIAALQKALLKR